MKRISARPETFKSTLSVTDLEKYLDFNSEIFYSDEDKSAFQILPATEKKNSKQKEREKSLGELTIEEISKENKFSKTEVNEKGRNMEVYKKYKRKNIILQHEVDKLNEEIALMGRSHEEIEEELKEAQKENASLRKIVRYVVDEVLGEYSSSDHQGDALSYIKSFFADIKATLVSTQEAYLKQKSVVKKLKSENADLHKENFSNLELILKLNKHPEKIPIKTNAFSDIKSFQTYCYPKGHKKTNSYSVSKRHIDSDLYSYPTSKLYN